MFIGMSLFCEKRRPEMTMHRVCKEAEERLKALSRNPGLHQRANRRGVCKPIELTI